MKHYLSNIWMNISSNIQLVYQAKKSVFGHYSYWFDSK